MQFSVQGTCHTLAFLGAVLTLFYPFESLLIEAEVFQLFIAV